MTENFLINEVEEKLDFGKTLKISISGGTAKEQSISLKTALRYKDIKNILWGIDYFEFKDDINHNGEDFPFYLYDDNILNDYKYLFSIDTLIKSFKAYLYQYIKSKNSPLFDYNRMFEWQYSCKNLFTIKEVEKSWNREKNNIHNTNYQLMKYHFLKESFKYNVLRIIENNPNVKFTLFYPPYSILTYKNLEKQGLLKDFLEFRKYIYQSTKDLENVKIYDFQVAYKITHDLNNYKDLAHYNQKINSWMINQIVLKKYLLSKHSDGNNKILNKQITNYQVPF
jgi:hypothetical protein